MGERYEKLVKEMTGTDVPSVPEKLGFKFGPGRRVHSTRAIVVLTEMNHGQGTLYVRVSVIDGDVPCLMSNSVAQRYKALIDFDGTTMKFAGMKS